MSLAIALRELLASVEAGRGNAEFGFDDIQHWGVKGRELLISLQLLEPITSATSLECHGCEERCFSVVLNGARTNGETRPFILCEVPEKQEEMGRVPVALERLQQWRSTAAFLAQYIAGKLELGSPYDSGASLTHIRLGMLRGPEGRRWVSLTTSPLAVEINQHSVPLDELLFVESDTVNLDEPRIRHLLDVKTPSTSKLYQPNTDRRAFRKQETAAMYQDWCDTYAQLTKENPGMSKSWYANKISRMDIGRGKNSETIRKRLL